MRNTVVVVALTCAAIGLAIDSAHAGATVSWTHMATWTPSFQGECPAAGDLDGDQDVDLVLCQPVCALENAGTTDNPYWTRHDAWVDTLSPSGMTVHAEMGDLDADGDTDLLFGAISYGITYYENTGGSLSPVWRRNDDYFHANPPVWGLSVPNVTDLDGDGDLDIIVGIASTGPAFWCYWNDGTPTEPSWRLDTEAFADIHPWGSEFDMNFGDLDGDGDLDLVTVPVPGTGEFQSYENTGTATAAEWEFNLGLLTNVTQTDDLTGACLADLNGDGKLDLLLFGVWGYRFYRNDRPDTPVEPTSWGRVKGSFR